jgi:hypothetical protein
MTGCWGGWEENRQQQQQRQERGAEGLRPTLRQVHAKDGAPERFGLVGREQATAKAKYGGPSTTAARAPPSLRMTGCLGGFEENRQQQRQERRSEGLRPTLRQMHAKDGAPERFGLVGRELATARARQPTLCDEAAKDGPPGQ